MKFLPTIIALGACAGTTLFAQDSAPPQVVSTASLDATSIGVCFNEAVDPSTANDPSKYNLAGGATIDAAELQTDGTTVMLSVSGLTGATYNLTVNGVTDLAGNGVNVTLSGSVLGLTAQDLGVVEAPGKAIACAPGAVDVYARGLDIWGFEDSGHFVWEEKTGDFDVRVRLESFTGPSTSANAGLMLRESADAGSRNIQVVTYSNQAQWVGAERPETGAASRVLAGDWDIAWPAASAYPNIWLRIKRVGNTITTYGSINGNDWLQVGASATPEIPYPETVLVGMRTTPVEVQVAGSTAIAKYRDYGDYSITSGSINILSQPANVTVRENTAGTFSVNVEVTGAPASNLSYQWQRNGENIANANSASYTTPLLTQADSGAKYRVALSLPGGVVAKTSDEATVTVTQDSVAPTILSAASLDGLTVGIHFNELLDPAAASDPANYSISGVTIDSAALEADGMTVTLGVSGLTSSNFTVNVAGVTDLVGNVTTASTAGQMLGFTAQDIGIVEAPGRAISYLPGGADVWARGIDIWGAADSGHFIWKEYTGDFDVRVRVENFTAPAPDANAGLMARETLDAGSRNVSVVVYANQNNWTATQRVDTDGASSVLAGDWRINWPAGITYPNVWLRLKRSGDTFTTYGGTNGTEWIQIGQSVTPESAYPETLYLGLRTTPVEVEVPGSTAFAQYRDFGNFVLENVSINITNQPSAVTVLENTSATFSVGAEAVGTASSNLSYQWQRNGVDIPGAVSSSYNVNPALTADNNARFRVRITLPGGISVLSQEVALTVTEDITAPAIVSVGSISGDFIGIVFNEPLDLATAGDMSNYTVTGAEVTGATVQADGRTIVLNVSGLTGNNFTVNVNGVTDIEGNALNGTVSGQTLGLIATDLGVVPEPGFAFSAAPGSVDVTARGLDIWGAEDSGHFVYEERTGDFDVRVRLESFTAPAISANAGLMARENLEAGSRNVQVVTYANQAQWVSAQRVETGGASSVTAGDWDIAWPEGVGYPNIWMRLKREGETFTVYGGTNGVDWVQIGDSVTPANPYPETILVGMRTTPVEIQAAGTTAVARYRDYGDVVESDVPELSIARTSANQVTISWPTGEATGFVLEQTSALGSAWTEVTATPVTQGNTTSVTLSIDPTSNRFFRLKR
ncbi:MAG: Ig-like domain-containing protein [Verrucomicrobiales bacterium]